MRRSAKLTKAKAAAKVSVSRKAPKKEGAEVRDLEKRLAEALARGKATSDILRVISSSPTDIQPVFDAIVVSAIRLLAGYTGALTLIQNQQIELAVLTSTDDTGDAAVRATFPKSLQSVGAHPRAIRDRAPLNVTDACMDARLADGERTAAAARGLDRKSTGLNSSHLGIS